MTSPRLVTEQLFRAAVRSADPYAATLAALTDRPLGARPWIIAIGKGAIPMAGAALDALAAGQRSALGGIVIAPYEDRDVGPLRVYAGDHPLPGARSRESAERLGEMVQLVRPGDDVVVLVSGGATSLVAAPVDQVSPEALGALFRGLHRAGAPIDVMNAFRKRVLRWGAGRLGAALGSAHVTCLIASDVIGDDPGAIASGPCSGDVWDAEALIELAQARNLWPFIPDDVQRYLDRTLTGEVMETPKPGSPLLSHVETRIILGNRDALDGIAREGPLHGVPVRVAPTPVTGEARSIGASIGRAAIAARAHHRCADSLTTPCRFALVWGGETVVTLGTGRHGVGGRAQELALAAARELHEAGAQGRGITILSAGTDGRDGPTDAAGAIVDASTWTRVAMAGQDPAYALETHDAFPALDAAGALLRTGMTGTNVNDVVIALIDCHPSRDRAPLHA